MRASIVSCVLFALAAGCSDAETPNSGYDAGFRDSGTPGDPDPDVGGPNQPCDDLDCDSADLVCVTGGTPTCRLLCDLNDDDDPCGPGFTCEELSNGSGACLVASLVDGPCPCDEVDPALVCTRVGTANVCKVGCDPSADPGDAGTGPDAGLDGQGCPPTTECRPFLTGVDGGPSPDEGACLEP